jgi:histone deacetylase 6
MLVHHKDEVFQWIEERADDHEGEETEEEKRPSRSLTKPGDGFVKPI